MDDWNACWLQWWFLHRSSSVIHPTDLTLGLASVWFSKWFLSVWFSLSLFTDHTVRQIVYFDFSDSQTHIWKRCYHQIPMSKLSKFRLVGELRTWQTQSALAKSTVRRDFSEIFSSDQNIFDCQLFCRRPVEIILRPLAGRWEGSVLPSSVNISVTVSSDQRHAAVSYWQTF